jgi:hypothetical protein
VAATLEDELVELSRPDDADPIAAMGLVAEEIAPGVHLVLSDGIRDLRSEALPACEALACSAGDPPLDSRQRVDDISRGRVVAGLDGGIWLFWGDRFIRLGDETVHRWTAGQVPSIADDIEVAPDGTVWHAPSSGSGADRDRTDSAHAAEILQTLRADRDAVEARPDRLAETAWLTWPDGALRVYREGAWRDVLEAPLGPVYEVEIGSDDRVWTAVDGSDGDLAAPLVARLGADGWRLAPTPTGRVDRPHALTALRDGSVVFEARRRPVALWRLGAGSGPALESWQPLESDTGLREMVTSPDGIIWGTLAPETIARFDGDSWNEWDLAAGSDPRAPRSLGGGGPLAAGRDGSLWLKARPRKGAPGCHGVYRFDGTTWSRFLDGLCVHSIDVAPNGWVWLRAASDRPGDDSAVELYAIEPDARGT